MKLVTVYVLRNSLLDNSLFLRQKEKYLKTFFFFSFYAKICRKDTSFSSCFQEEGFLSFNSKLLQLNTRWAIF